MSKPLKHFYEFGRFRIDADERVLLRDGLPVALPPKVFDTLLVIVERSGHIVEKDELIQKVWPDTFVEENNLPKYISALRKSLGDGRHEQRYIETVPRRGYRFTAGVREFWDEEEELVGVSRTRMSLRIQEETEDDAPAPASASRPSFGRRRAVFAASVLLAAAAVMAAASGMRGPGSGGRVTALPRIKTLAVLPLRSGVGDERFLGLSIADDLVARLGQSLHARVRPTSAVYKYMSAERDAAAAGRELKADTVLDGEVKKVGGRVSVSLRLLGTGDGALLWEGRFEEDAGSFFDAQGRAVEKLAREAFSVPASSLNGLHARRRTASLEAQEADVRGRYLWSDRTAESLHRSITYFERAITHDPEYALAYAGLADAYAFDRTQWPKAEAAARKALELDQSLGQPHATIGFVRWFWLWDWQEAEREYKLAIALSPEYATARQWYAIFLAARDYPREAKDEMLRALELEPFSLPINADLGQILYFMGDYDAAIEQCRKALALDPGFVNARAYLYQAYTQKGMYEEAVAEYFKLREITDGNSGMHPQHEAALRAAYASGGIRAFWREKLSLEASLGQKGYLQAELHILLGERDEALRILDHSVRRRDPFAIFLKVNPVFKDLRADPRFRALVERLERRGPHKADAAE
jgi:DNA-binding winged helix-turn-helix (wHTH) protein/tetratricopeptide (TPR) repeat protein